MLLVIPTKRLRVGHEICHHSDLPKSMHRRPYDDQPRCRPAAKRIHPTAIMKIRALLTRHLRVSRHYRLMSSARDSFIEAIHFEPQTRAELLGRRHRHVSRSGLPRSVRAAGHTSSPACSATTRRKLATATCDSTDDVDGDPRPLLPRDTPCFWQR